MSASARTVKTIARWERTPGARLHQAIQSLAEAADRGPRALFAEAPLVLRTMLGATGVRLLVRAGGAWRDWDRLEGIEDEPPLAGLPEEPGAPNVITDINGSVFVEIQPGCLAVMIEGLDDAGSHHEPIFSICNVLGLAFSSSETKRGKPDRLEAIHVFQRVANRILKSRNLPEIFLQITHEAKIRLSADICGIMVLEDDTLAMQRCVGNLAVETAALRMRAGQGVGGLVLDTRAPCVIEDYVRSEIISRDFFDLARAERVRSALAVPVMSQDKVIGVLEVWRRRPSVFTPQHMAELATLADLTALAIETVSLAEKRAAAAQRLEEAHAELQRRYEVIRKSTELQEILISTLLGGGSLPDIIEKAHEHLGTPILVLDSASQVRVCYPIDAYPDERLQLIRTAIARGSGSETKLASLSAGSLRFSSQRVTVGSESLGWVVVLDPPQRDESAQLTITELCVTIALHQTKERAAARALSDKLASLMWDLLEGPEHLRGLAVERAKELNVELAGEYHVLVCDIEGLDMPNDTGRLTGRDIETRRRSIAAIPGRLAAAYRTIRFSGLRGSELVVVGMFRDARHGEEIAHALMAEIGRLVPAATPKIGISRGCSNPMAMPEPFRDARIALAVARHGSGKRVVAFHDAGIAGLLMSMREGPDFQSFIREKLGRLLLEKNPQRDVLLNTLHVFFKTNCSQQATAQELRTHQKTIAYRLDKVSRITGIDLSSHEDRVLLYLALKMNELIM